METCHYEIVATIPEDDGSNAIPRKYLLRQILICSGICTSFFFAGLSFGSPTVFIPQLRREINSTETISVEMASWLSSTLNYSGIVGSFFLAFLAKLIGRKLSFLVTSITAMIAYIVFYCSTTVNEIIISEILHALVMANPVTLSVMVITEYTSPRYRGVFLTLKSATFLWGVWLANAIGTFFHWKNIIILAFICSIYCTLTVLFWPESPYWLANKNRFDDCAVSHRWLKGRSREAEAELELLIQTRKKTQSEHYLSLNIFRKIAEMFRSKLFYKPIILAMLALSLYHFSGKIACGMYAIDIIKRITGTESAAYTGMLILDGITVLGMYIGCGFSKILKRRTMLLVSSAIGVLFLFSISIYLYLIHYGIIFENYIISISLLMCYSLSISGGSMIMSTTILGELIPVKYRTSSILILGSFANFLMGSLVKISPFIINYYGVRGLFLFFSVTELLFTIINYRVLPETKDKTILEIQENLLGSKSNTKPVDYVAETD